MQVGEAAEVVGGRWRLGLNSGGVRRVGVGLGVAVAVVDLVGLALALAVELAVLSWVEDEAWWGGVGVAVGCLCGGGVCVSFRRRRESDRKGAGEGWHTRWCDEGAALEWNARVRCFEVVGEAGWGEQLGLAAFDIAAVGRVLWFGSHIVGVG